MAEIIKTYKQSIPALRFIGKKYTDEDRVDGSFGAKWGEWFQNGWFDALESLFDDEFIKIYEDGKAYIGLMKEVNDGFEYWVGMFAPEKTTVPNGYISIDYNEGELGVCWIYGSESEVYMLEGQCGEKLEKEGFNICIDWCFERYACPRFTTPDDKGNIILNYSR